MTDPNQALSEATREQRAGRRERAWAIVSKVIEQHPEHANARHCAAELKLAAGDAVAAKAFIDDALKLAPTNNDFLASKAYCLVQLGQLAEAGECAAVAFANSLADPVVLTKLGNVFTSVQKFDLAQSCFERAVAASPDNGAFQYNLGTALRFAGEFDRAEACFNEAIRLRPMDHEGIYARSGLRKQTREHNNLDHLHACALRNWPDWRAQVHVFYALAKEYEDIGEWDTSFAWLKKGADLRRANTRYDVAGDVAKLDTLGKAFGPDLFAASAEGCGSDAPIFVLGLPRAGSTLVDRILSAHSDVTSAGELPTFGQKVVEHAQKLIRAGDKSFQGFVEATLRIDPKALGEDYLSAARFATGERAHFVDKLPFNFLYIGLIKRALPNAKIIHVHRAPMDACYGMYKMLFLGAYPFSYDLNDLGAYYIAYRRLMDHWRRVLPDGVQDLSYERLVRDQAAESRSLLAFCGLDWEDACLDFHLNAAPSTTASAVQVREPINAKSLGQWKRYERQLAPLAAKLRAGGVNLDAAA